MHGSNSGPSLYTYNKIIKRNICVQNYNFYQFWSYFRTKSPHINKTVHTTFSCPSSGLMELKKKLILKIKIHEFNFKILCKFPNLKKH